MEKRKPLINIKTLNELDKRRVMWNIVKLLQNEGLSYRQAGELLEDTKDQLKNIPIKITSQ